MPLETLLSILKYISYAGALIIFVSTVGISVVTSRLDSTKDGKIDQLLSQNKELISKIDGYQIDLSSRDATIKELRSSAQRTSQGIYDRWEYDGSRRETHGGTTNITEGHEIEIFQQIIDLEKKQDFASMINLCLLQIEETPDWLTPYFYLGVAYANTGRLEEAAEKMQYVIDNSFGDPAYSHVAKLLKKIRDHMK